MKKQTTTVRKNGQVMEQSVTDKQKQRIRRELALAKKYQNLHQSATDRGIEFGLTLADLRAVMSRKRCEFTGLPSAPNDKLSLDRVDNTKGYVPGNVTVMRTTVNAKKGCLTIEEILTLAKGVQKFLKRQGVKAKAA